MKDAKQVTDAVRGQVLAVNGMANVTEYVKYGDVMDPMSGSYTAAIWFKLTDWGPIGGGDQMLLSKGMNNSTGNEGWRVFFTRVDDTGGEISVCGNYDGTGDNRLGVKHTVSFGQWYHIALVIDQESGSFKGYLDGLGSGTSGTENGWSLAYGNTFTPGGVVDFDSTEELMLARHNGSRYPFVGQLDDLAIWSRALSDAEISGIYQGTIVIPEPSSLVLVVLGLFGLMIVPRGRSR
jgi:hypothetical protein